MPVIRLFLLSRKGQADLSDTVVDSAINALYPVSRQSWSRDVTFWSQRKTGQDENMLRVSGGALQPMVSVETYDGNVALIRAAQGNKRPDVLQCGEDIVGLLRSMAYIEQKEVKLTGQCHSLGDVSVLSGSIIRRTNDTQVVGRFIGFVHSACDLLQQTQTALREVQQMLLEELQLAVMPRKLTLPELFVAAPVPQHLGNRFTAKHESLTYLWVASNV